MTLLALFAAMAAQPGPATPPGSASAAGGVTIPAKDLAELDRCRPKFIREAAECMRRALGERASAEINTPAGEPYRAAFVGLITKKWNLADPDAPVSRDMRGLRIYDPSDAGYVLLFDLQARVGRYRLDYERFARERSAGRWNSATPPRPAPTATADEPKPGPLPLERCQRPADGPEVKIVTCTLNDDRTISRTVSGAAGVQLPEGATPTPLEECAQLGPIPAGARLKACFRLPDGRLLRQTARLAEPPPSD